MAFQPLPSYCSPMPTPQPLKICSGKLDGSLEQILGSLEPAVEDVVVVSCQYQPSLLAWAETLYSCTKAG